MIDNYEKTFKYFPPFKDELIHHAKMNRNIIGNKFEKALYPKMSRLHRINLESNDLYYNNVHFEILRIIYSLNFSGNMIKLIEKLYWKVYDQFPLKGMRRHRITAPVVIYLFYIEKQKHVNPKKLLSISNCTKGEFNKCLIKILEKNPDIHNKIRSSEFRIKYILNLLYVLNDHFKFPIEFLSTARKVFKEKWPLLKKMKNILVVGMIFTIVREELWNKMQMFSEEYISKYIGLSNGAVTAHKKKFGLPLRHGGSKISDKDARQIKEDYINKIYTNAQLSRKYNLSWSGVYYIINKRINI